MGWWRPARSPAHFKPGTYERKEQELSIDLLRCKTSQFCCTDASSCIQECLAGLVRSSVLQGLEPSQEKVRLPHNVFCKNDVTRNALAYGQSMIQIQKPSRAEGRKPADSPKMMPCSIKVRRDWRLEVGYWLQEVIMWFLWFFMVLLIYCYVCLCALFISSFDLMWRAAMIWGWFQSKIMSWPSRESTVAALRPSWGQGQAATFQQVAAHTSVVDPDPY